MEMLDSVMVIVPLKVVWKSASIMYGAQYVIIIGVTLMQVWFADNWDILQQVRLCYMPGMLYQYYLVMSNEEIQNQTPYNFQEHLLIKMLHLVVALVQYTIVAFVVMDLKIDLLIVHLGGQNIFVDMMMMLVFDVKQEQV